MTSSRRRNGKPIESVDACDSSREASWTAVGKGRGHTPLCDLGGNIEHSRSIVCFRPKAVSAPFPASHRSPRRFARIARAHGSNRQ